MIASVSLLDDASHAVRLALGALDDGSRKGNSESPTVPIAPSGTRAEPMNAKPGRERKRIVEIAPAKARIGAVHRTGITQKFISHAPRTSATVFSRGLDGALWSIGMLRCAPFNWATQKPASAN